jgi:hypothetical protein
VLRSEYIEAWSGMFGSSEGEFLPLPCPLLDAPQC